MSDINKIKEILEARGISQEDFVYFWFQTKKRI